MSAGGGDALIAEYRFARGEWRGTLLKLLESRLLHLGTDYTESTALDAIAAVRIGFARDARRIGWGAAFAAAGVLVYALASPLDAVVGREVADVSAQVARDAANAAPLVQFLEAALRALRFVAGLMPAAALLLIAWGAALAVLGWVGHTSLALVLPSAEREFRVPGRELPLMDFAENVAQCVAARLRR